MMVHPGRRRTPLLLLALMSNIWHAHGLSQEYCSSENTGSSYDAVSNIYQSNGACQEQCVDNYAFAIVQYKQCWCSNYAPADQVDVSQCSQACPGYPDESCGDEDSGLYGYIALSISPSGTQGSGSSSSQTSSSSSQASSTSTTESNPSSSTSSSVEESESTVYSSVSVTVTAQQSASVSVTVSYVTATSSDDSTTTSSPSSTVPSTTSTSMTLTSTQAAAVTTSTQSSSSDPTSASHTTMVSTRVVTIAGAPVTQTVTSTAVVQPGSDSQKATAENKGISGGTVAGAVVGSVVGVALILAGAFFIWRRRRSQGEDPESPDSSGSAAARRNTKRMERNTSVLSKTGLLSSAANPTNPEKFSDEPTAFSAAGSHRYQNSSSTAQSPIGAGDIGARRDSRPMLYDQRLNPVALMEHWERNGSRASIGTMQDQRDYSRPLGVTNPDPTDDD